MTLEERVNSLTTAIFVIDVQNDFCHENGAFTEGFNVVIPHDLVATTVERQGIAESILELLSSYCAEVVTSKDVASCWQS